MHDLGYFFMFQVIHSVRMSFEPETRTEINHQLLFFVFLRSGEQHLKQRHPLIFSIFQYNIVLDEYHKSIVPAVSVSSRWATQYSN